MANSYILGIIGGGQLGKNATTGVSTVVIKNTRS